MKMLRKIFIGIALIGCFFIVAPIFHIFATLNSKELFFTLKDKEVWHSLFVSFYGASWATILGCIFGIPFAYFLSRCKFKAKYLLESIINLPVAIPHVAVGIALLSLFNERTFLGRLFYIFHVSFIDTIYGIVLAMSFVSISFVISSALIGFNSVDPSLEMVSRSLGASSGYTFWHITFPLALPAILRGAVLAFARSLSEVGALLILAYYPKTAPILMYERFEEYGLKASKPVTALVIFISLIVFFALLHLSKRHVRY